MLRAVLATALSVGALASAQQSPGAPVGEQGTLRLRFGLALRSGQQTDLGPGLTYSGITPNDAALTGAWWVGGGHFGLALAGQREGFALLGSAGERITGGSLWRAHLGPTARLPLGPVMLEGLVGYGLAQLPSFGDNSVTPAFSAATRHGPVFGARASVQLPFSLRLEARGDYPLGLFAQDGSGAAAQTTGFSAGGALIWNGGSLGRVLWSVVADYQYVRDTLTVGSTVAGSQTLSRAGLGLEFALLERPPPPPPPPVEQIVVPVVEAPPKVGALALVLVDQQTAAPVVGARIRLNGQEYRTGPGGNVTISDLPPGPVALQIDADTYRPLEEVASVVVARTATVPLQLVKVEQKVQATLTGVVRSRGGRPLAATLEIPQAKLRTTASRDGTFAVRITGGTYTVRISAPGYLSQQKTVTVRDGDQAIFNVDLYPAR